MFMPFIQFTILEGRSLEQKERLIHEVSTQSIDEAVELKRQVWLKSPVQAMIHTKLILCEQNRPSLLKVLELEKTAQTKMRQTSDHKEGIQAFIEKRRAIFTGK